MLKRTRMNRSMIQKRFRPRIKLENAPPVNCINDLIELGNSVKFYKNLDTIMLWRITPYLKELDKLVGMDDLKESVFFQIIYYLQSMHSRNSNQEYLHTIIMGPPGTGKTTVARILGKIYQALGILSSSGAFKIAYRDDFIAEYLGQTAIKTRKLLTSCIGGVLFIDEIYSLAPRHNDRDSFSKEALDTLTAFLSEHKNDFCCIAAGYEEDIHNCFFNMNRGLQRRFPWIHKIQPYKSSELTMILIKMVQDMNWHIDIDTHDIINLIEKNKEMFTYAGGDIETFLSKCKMTHAKRVFNLDKIHKFKIIMKDCENAIELIKKYKKEPDEIPKHMYL